ncbi:hypothetical protein EVAR_1031_1 [Eumeta japonica]|uniref:Uncharacterized protein n=1 Tax=Eumeta variegata TaxID=151549 RepID=A0A4C1SHA9_EUMVA|nr:hypothetical protein EVAR_1031_1 [Eumeta japonica]
MWRAAGSNKDKCVGRKPVVEAATAHSLDAGRGSTAPPRQEMVSPHGLHGEDACPQLAVKCGLQPTAHPPIRRSTTKNLSNILNINSRGLIELRTVV